MEMIPEGMIPQDDSSSSNLVGNIYGDFFGAPFVLLSSSDEPLENFFAKKKTKIIVRNQTIVNFDTKGIE